MIFYETFFCPSVVVFWMLVCLLFLSVRTKRTSIMAGQDLIQVISHLLITLLRPFCVNIQSSATARTRVYQLYKAPVPAPLGMITWIE
jgi:formate hydrogenlyase subunit 4